MANFGFTEHQQIIEKLCRICGERLMKAKDRYENSFACVDKRDMIFSAFGVKIREDDLETCPPKFCHKCYKLASRGGTRLAINVWPPHKRTGVCIICSSFREQQKPGRKKKSKPGVKPPTKDSNGSKEGTEIVEGMSGTLSFQPDENVELLSHVMEKLKSYRGTEPLYPEHFAENIKHEYICPICKEVLDQPVQTKCPTPHIFCGSCLSFSFDMCGPQCPVCRTLIENPGESIEPAPFVLQTIISELEFRCSTCSQAIKLHQLPQHQQEGCVPGPPPSNPNTASNKEVTLHSDPVVHVHKPTTQTQTVMPVPEPPPLPNPPAPAPGPTVAHAELPTVQQLIHSPAEAYSSFKEEVGLFVIRQFPKKSQDGTTILLKTGGQVNNTFQFQNT